MALRDALIEAITQAATTAVDSVLGTGPAVAPVQVPPGKPVRARRPRGTKSAARSGGAIVGWQPNEKARRVPKAILEAIGIKIEKGSKDRIAQRFGVNSVWDVKDGTVYKDGKPFSGEAHAAPAPAAKTVKAKGPIARKKARKG